MALADPPYACSLRSLAFSLIVMAGLDPAIHVSAWNTWMPRTRPDMTKTEGIILY
jgi:hypothetical protein